jgi:hypothetical protein
MMATVEVAGGDAARLTIVQARGWKLLFVNHGLPSGAGDEPGSRQGHRFGVAAELRRADDVLIANILFSLFERVFYRDAGHIVLLPGRLWDSS